MEQLCASTLNDMSKKHFERNTRFASVGTIQITANAVISGFCDTLTKFRSSVTINYSVSCIKIIFQESIYKVK
jgi:hypothetical protein